MARARFVVGYGGETFKRGRAYRNQRARDDD